MIINTAFDISFKILIYADLNLIANNLSFLNSKVNQNILRFMKNKRREKLPVYDFLDLLYNIINKIEDIKTNNSNAGDVVITAVVEIKFV